MKRNLKALGLVLLAVLALGAVGATAAQAVTHEFTTDTGEPVELTAEALTEQVLTTEGGSELKCSELQLANATVETAASAITAEPIYNNEENTCTNTFIGSTQVATEGCHYTFHGETDAEGHAQMDITGCSGEAEGIVFTNGLECVITVPEQELTGVHYYNVPAETPNEDLELEARLEGVLYTATSACELVGIASGEGAYAGTATVTGWEDDGLENETHGSRVGISVSPGDETE